MCTTLSKDMTLGIVAQLAKFNFCHFGMTGMHDRQTWSILLWWLVKYSVRLLTYLWYTPYTADLTYSNALTEKN
jgi:hypothetical protein